MMYDILNPDGLISVSNGHSLDFVLNPLIWITPFIKVTFDNNYRYNAISIERGREAPDVMSLHYADKSLPDLLGRSSLN